MTSPNLHLISTPENAFNGRRIRTHIVIVRRELWPLDPTTMALQNCVPTFLVAIWIVLHLLLILFFVYFDIFDCFYESGE